MPSTSGKRSYIHESIRHQRNEPSPTTARTATTGFWIASTKRLASAQDSAAAPAAAAATGKGKHILTSSNRESGLFYFLNLLI
jgi:hypothetical protein